MGMFLRLAVFPLLLAGAVEVGDLPPDLKFIETFPLVVEGEQIETATNLPAYCEVFERDREIAYFVAWRQGILLSIWELHADGRIFLVYRNSPNGNPQRQNIPLGFPGSQFFSVTQGF